MSDTVRLLILDGSMERRESIKALLQVMPRFHIVGEGGLDNKAPMRVMSDNPDIVLVSIDPGDSENSVILEHISAQSPDIGIIVLSEHKDWYLVRQYMRAGAKDYLYMPVTPAVLERTIDEVIRLMNEKSVIAPELEKQRQASARCKTYAFFSGKGGVGRTTLSVNVATALAMSGHSTVLVDLALYAGGDHILLNIVPSWTIMDLLQQTQELDRELLQHYLSYHQDSGLWLLPAPHQAEEMELLVDSDFRLMMKALQREFDYVVVDTASMQESLLLTTLEVITRGFLVNMLNIAVIKSNQSILDFVRKSGYAGKIATVLNNADSRTGVTAHDVERVLGVPLTWQFPSDYTLVETAANAGVPFVLKHKRNRLARSIDGFSQKLLQTDN